MGSQSFWCTGNPDSWWSYASVMQHLPEELRVIALSLRGYGQSDRSYGNYHPRDLAADLNEFMVRLGIPAAYVVGHSMGSYVAEYLALDHPERVLGLVLIGTFRTLVGRADLAELLSTLEQMDEEDRSGPGARLPAKHPGAGRAGGFSLDTIIAESALVPGHVWRGALRDLMRIDHFDELAPDQGAHRHFLGRPGQHVDPARPARHRQSRRRRAAPLYRGGPLPALGREPKRFAQDLVKLINQIENPGQGVDPHDRPASPLTLSSSRASSGKRSRGMAFGEAAARGPWQAGRRRPN
jgi:pimeloyl-ACP methyl ester carboxylesterase